MTGKDGGRLLFTVENLGPLRSAHIEIPVDGLTIVIGPNASGKTFLAESLLLALETYAIAALRSMVEGKRRVSFELPRADVYFGAGFEALDAKIRLVGRQTKVCVNIRGRRGLAEVELGAEILDTVEESKADAMKQLEKILRGMIKGDERDINKIASVIFDLLLKQRLASVSGELLDPQLYMMPAYTLVAYVPTERIALAPLL